MPDGALLISNRTREVWTRADHRLLQRVAKLFQNHGDSFQLVCRYPLCPDPKIRLAQDETAPGGRVLRCGHLDRAFSRW